jgi:hypothetical protein
MAGSSAALYRKKTFIYVPPSPPAELIQSTSYTLDFAARKFVQIGVDPTEKFKVIVHLLTSSRYVYITPDFLKKFFSFMGSILSFILDTPQRYKRVVFFEDEMIKLSSMVYNEENMLVIEAKKQQGYRVLLNRADLIRLQYLERCIIESISRKEIFTIPIILKQYDAIVNFLYAKCSLEKQPPKNVDEMRMFVNKNTHYSSEIVETCPDLTDQIQMCAAKQISESILNRMAQDSQEVIHKYIIITCTKILISLFSAAGSY